MNKSELMLFDILENVEAYIYLKDTEGKYLFANKPVRELFGATMEEIVGQGDEKFFDDATVNMICANDHEVLVHGKILRTEDTNRNLKDGTSATYLSVKLPLRNAAGEIYALCGISTDITARKQAEEQLAESEARLRTIIENEPECIKVVDKTGKLRQMNQAGLEMIEADSLAQVLGLSVYEVITPPYRDAFVELHQRVIAGERMRMEFEIQGLKGGRRWLETHAVPMNDNGEAVHLAVTRDITDRKAVENALRYSEQRFRDVSEAAGEYLWEIDANMVYTYVSPRSTEVKGYTPNELLGHTPMEFMPAEDIEPVAQIVNTAIANKASFKLQHRDITRSGEVLWEEVNGVPIYDAQGHVVGLRGTGLNITDRKRAEDALRYSEQRLSIALEGSGDCVWDWDLLSNQVVLSKGGAAMFGFADDEISTDMAEWQKRVHWDDVPRLFADIRSFFHARIDKYASEYRVRCKDGSWKWILMRGMVAHRNEQGRVTRMIGTHADLTTRKLAEEKLQLAGLVYENSTEAMMITDGDNRILGINPAFTHTTGYALEEVLGKTPSFLNSGRQGPEFYRDMWQAIKTTGHWQGEMWNRRKDGEIYVEWQTINTIFNDDGTPHRHVALFSDITQKKANEELIWKQANFDALTGLPNRRMFHDRLAQELKKSARAGLPLALMFIDLDHFKEVNDTLGHDQGDLLLIEASKRIRDCVRESDTVARLGGDEFTVILPVLEDVGSVDRIAQSIIEKLTCSFLLGKESVFVSASIGITLYPGDAAEIETLLKNADQAMYVAKNAGRNRYRYFTHALQEAAQTRMRLTNDLRIALADHQFRVYYQPIVEMATGEIHKAEALIRWLHPERGLVSPAQFIPLAEESGLINEIGDWVFHETASQVAHWRATHTPSFQISVNKSPAQFRQSNVHHESNWLAHLAAMSLHGQSISIEITEGLLLNAEADIKDKLFELRDAGVQIAIDDFGTGYSSLAYLKKFDIDYLKIDQTFVSNLENDADDLALCEAIIVMAHKLGLKVIAEGVETEQQRRILAMAGCDYAQGFLFSKAVPSEEFEAMLAKNRRERLESSYESR